MYAHFTFPYICVYQEVYIFSFSFSLKMCFCQEKYIFSLVFFLYKHVLKHLLFLLFLVHALSSRKIKCKWGAVSSGFSFCRLSCGHSCRPLCQFYGLSAGSQLRNVQRPSPFSRENMCQKHWCHIHLKKSVLLTCKSNLYVADCSCKSVIFTRANLQIYTGI